MGGQQSKPHSPSHAENEPARESETFLVNCDEDEQGGVTSSPYQDSRDPAHPSIEIRASWEAPTASERSLSLSGSRRSVSSISRVSSTRRSRESLSNRPSSWVSSDVPLRSSDESLAERALTSSLVDSAQNFAGGASSLDPLPEERLSDPRTFSSDSAHWPIPKQPHQATPSPQPSAAAASTGIGFEQILLLYLQLTDKNPQELTEQDISLVTQLTHNPQLLAQQLAQLPQPQSVSTPAVNPQLSSQEKALLDLYQCPPAVSYEPTDPYASLSAEERALIEGPSNPSDFQASTGTGVSPSREEPPPPPPPAPFALENDQTASTAAAASNPLGFLSQEERELLEVYQGPSTGVYQNISEEERAIIGEVPSPSPLQLQTYTTSAAATTTNPAAFEPSLQNLTVEEQAYLNSAYQLVGQPFQSPFGALTAEERAILGERTSKEIHHQESQQARSEDSSSNLTSTDDQAMEPQFQQNRFSTSSSSFFSPEVHPDAVRSSRMQTASTRSSGTRSSFADEQRHVRPSMDIAGGQYTRASGVQGTVPPRVASVSIDRGSRVSEVSSQNTSSNDLPAGLPMTALPPMVPPPPPSEPPPSTSHGAVATAQEMDAAAVTTACEGNAPVHDRMERLNVIRSSFAAERKTIDCTGAGSETAIFEDVSDSGKIIFESETLAAELRRRYHQLAVLPEDTPFPLTLLSMLWGVVQPVALRDAESAAMVMQSKKILKVAVLEDGTFWCMMNADHASKLKEKTRDQLPAMHSRLINLYRQGFQDLALVPDDNYFVQNVAYHLTQAERLEELASLLSDAIWLETKLRSYGTGPVVADFRRYFGCQENPVLTLMLRAFQVSANGSLDYSSLYVLKEQMLGRLMVAARENPGIMEWYEQGVKEWRMVVPYRKSRSMPVHLLPKTPSLEQAGGLQRLILKGHNGGIRKVQLAPNGLEVITASADGTIRVWDMEIGDFVLKMEDHDGPVSCFALSKDGNVLVSGGEDGVAIVYDLPSGIWRHKLCGHTKRINAVSIDPLCRRAVTSSRDMSTRIWSLSQGTCLHVLSEVAGARGHMWEEWAGHHDMAISPDSRIVVTVDGEFRVRVWTVETAALTDTLEGHSDWVVSLSFAGDSGMLLTASHDKTLRLWDLWKGCCEHVFTGHRGRINNLKVTDDGRRAVSVSDDAIGIVWDVKERQKVCELVGHMAWINDAAITQDGQRVITVSGDELGIVWDGNSGEVLRILKGHSGEINGVSISYKGRFAITGSTDTTARVWDLTAPSTHLEDFHHAKVTKILYHPNDNKVVTIGEDCMILIWDLTTCRCTHIIRSQSNINFAFLVADGSQLITASGDRCLCVWDMESGNRIRRLPPHTGSRVKSIVVSPDGLQAVIVLFDSTVTVWNLETMELKSWLMRRAERDGVHVHAAAVNDVVMTMAGHKALTVSKDHTIRLWDLDASATAMILKGHEDGVDLIEVKEDGTMCMTAGYDQTARLWDLSSGECTMVLDHPKDIDVLAVDSSWRRAVTVAGENTAWLWDIVRGRCLGILESQGDYLCGAVFSPDGRFLATFSANSVIRVWTSTSGKLRAVYLADSGISTCQFAGSPEIDTLVVGDGNGHVHFLEFPAKELASSRHKKQKE